MTRFCPHCGAVAEIAGVWDDEETGNELVDWTCPNGNQWTQPSMAQIVRSIGWGHLWRARRDQILDNG